MRVKEMGNYLVIEKEKQMKMEKVKEKQREKYLVRQMDFEKEIDLKKVRVMVNYLVIEMG